MPAVTHPARHRHRWHAPEKGSGPAFALSLLAHALLFIAIAFVVRWKSEPVGTVSAELWSLPPPAAVQQPVTPPPPVPAKVEPPPPEPPRKADIVEEKKPPPKIEPKKVEPKKEEPKKEEPKKIDPPKKAEPPKQDEAKIAKGAADAQLKRLLAQAGTAPSGTAGGGGFSDKYAAQVITCIRPHIVFNVPDSISPQQHVAVFDVMLLPTGEQTGAPRLIKGSGLAAYDQAVERAIRRCDPFPPPREGTMPRSVRLLFDPVETR
jgi:colicin import membrane protein